MTDVPQQNYRNEAPLGLPHGSVRGLLALLVTAGIWVWLLLRPEVAVPSYLRDLMFIIMGHYFASRSVATSVGGPAPLYLPRGSIRTILMLGFLGVGVWLYREQHLFSSAGPTHAAVTLILVISFLLGVLLERFTPRRVPRIIHDVPAIISLIAGAALLLLVFGVVAAPRSGIEAFLLRHSVEEVLAGIVGFYFGSRS